MESFERILQRMEEEYERESGCKVEDVSEAGIRLRVLAGELYRLSASLDWLERQAFPQTATGEQLDLHGAQRGVVRREAVKAGGTVTFSRYLPLAFDLVVPQGTVCATSGEPVVEYETTQEAVLEAGELTVDVPVQAVVAGAAGNAAAPVRQAAISIAASLFHLCFPVLMLLCLRSFLIYGVLVFQSPAAVPGAKTAAPAVILPLV